MSFKRGDVVYLLSGSDELLGTVDVEQVEDTDRPLDPQRKSIRCLGRFQPTAAWQSSEARHLFLELDEAVNSCRFSVLDKLVSGIQAKGIQLAWPANGARIPFWFIMIADESGMHWETETGPSPV